MIDRNFSEQDDLNDLIPSFDKRGMDLELERIKGALDAMSNPCSSIPAIQIVGTNGKGSIASFIETTLINTKIKTGVTISPHLVNWNERIRTNGKLITLKELRYRINSLKEITKNYKLTPFEILIAAAFAHFEEKKVEVLVLEVGLGGRLDATTAHPFRPIIAVASIGLDHCEHLGKDLTEIAQEKAAVINDKSIVVSAPQHPEVKKVLEEVANKKKAKLKWVPLYPERLELGIPGAIQRKNAAVAKGALEALKEFGWSINEKNIQISLSKAKWPARLQFAYWNQLPLLIDCSHNPPAAFELSKERKRWKDQELGVKWIFSIQINKDAPEMLRNLLEPKDLAWILPVPEHLSWDHEKLIKACPEFSNQLFNSKEIEDVFSRFSSKNKWPSPPPVITGSIYFIGSLIRNKVIMPRENEKFYL